MGGHRQQARGGAGCLAPPALPTSSPPEGVTWPLTPVPREALPAPPTPPPRPWDPGLLECGRARGCGPPWPPLRSHTGPAVASSRDHVAESPRHLLSGPFQTCLPAVLGPGSAVPASQRGLATRGTALPREGPRGGRRVFLAVPPDLHSPAQARGPTRRFHGEPCSSSEPALGMGSHTEPQKPIVTENVILDTDLRTETRTSTTQGSRSDLRSPAAVQGAAGALAGPLCSTWV